MEFLIKALASENKRGPKLCVDKGLPYLCHPVFQFTSQKFVCFNGDNARKTSAEG